MNSDRRGMNSWARLGHGGMPLSKCDTRYTRGGTRIRLRNGLDLVELTRCDDVTRQIM